MSNFPGPEPWMIGSGYEILVTWSFVGPDLNELSARIHNSRPYSSHRLPLPQNMAARSLISRSLHAQARSTFCLQVQKTF